MALLKVREGDIWTTDNPQWPIVVVESCDGRMANVVSVSDLGGGCRGQFLRYGAARPADEALYHYHLVGKIGSLAHFERIAKRVRMMLAPATPPAPPRRDGKDR